MSFRGKKQKLKWNAPKAVPKQQQEVVLSLLQLQDQIKRDPSAYHPEFDQQMRHFEPSLEIFRLKPNEASKDFGELVGFIAAVSHCFPEETAAFPEKIKALLLEHHEVLDPDLRKTLCQALILLRNRGTIETVDLLELFFLLFKCPDKHLRELLYKHILNDIKRLNKHATPTQLNKKLQNFMFTMLSDSNVIAAKKSLELMVALYRKKVWTDGRTVNVIASALFAESAKIKVTALQFFLGVDEMDGAADYDSEEEKAENETTSYQRLLQNTSRHMNNKRKNLLKGQLKKEKKKDAKVAEKLNEETNNFTAYHLLNDPQTLAEKLFQSLKVGKDRWEVQMMLMNMISRIINIHELIVLNFYPYLERYLWPHKQNVCQVLAFVAQACHEYVPPDTLESVLMKIAHNFVSDKSSTAVMAVGINSIREICARCPLAMTETLLHDLAQYKRYKDKGVMAAAKGLIGTFRKLNPEMLHKKDRGRPEDDDFDDEDDGPSTEYGARHAFEAVPGTALLSLYRESEAAKLNAENGGAAAGDASDDDGAAEEGESDSGEWEDVGSDEEGEEGDESDGEEEADGDDDSDGGGENKSGEAAEMSFNAGSDGEADSEDEVIDTVSKEERQRRAIQLSQTEPLTQEDFELIKKLQMENKVMPAGEKKRRRQAEDMAEGLREQRLDPLTLLPDAKKVKQDKEERLQAIKEGRDPDQKFGRKKSEKAGGTTNNMKARKKNPNMVKQASAKKEKRNMAMHDRNKIGRVGKKQFRGSKSWKWGGKSNVKG